MSGLSYAGAEDLLDALTEDATDELLEGASVAGRGSRLLPRQKVLMAAALLDNAAAYLHTPRIISRALNSRLHQKISNALMHLRAVPGRAMRFDLGEIIRELRNMEVTIERHLRSGARGLPPIGAGPLRKLAIRLRRGA